MVFSINTKESTEIGSKKSNSVDFSDHIGYIRMMKVTLMVSMDGKVWWHMSPRK